MKIKLYTVSDELVTEIETPPFVILPEGIKWGDRVFFRNEDNKYVEGLLYHALGIAGI
jgi:hypothetical protein